MLVALTWPNHVHHGRAHAWFAASDADWATSALTESALIRLSMNAAVVGRTVAAREAIALVQALRAHDRHRFVVDRSSLASARIDLRRMVGHGQVTDLHLVNLCAEEGLRLATLDERIIRMLDPADRIHVELVP